MRVTVTLMCAIFMAAVMHVSHQSSATPAHLPRAEALETVRAINTAELDAFLKHKTYVPLLEASQNLKGRSGGLNLVPAASDSSFADVRDYRISLITSPDAKHYKLSMTPASASSGCAEGFFSDESGVIYLGPPLDCAH